MAEIQGWNPTDASNTDIWPENMAFSAVNDAGRAMQGLLARWYRDTVGSLASTGSSNAFAVTSNRTIASLTNGTRLSFTANHSITGAATLNLNGLGAKDIKRFNGSALASGDIISGQPVDVIYSSALDDWIMVSALAALVGSLFADFAENGSPGDPAADTARLYAKDDGSGTTIAAYRDSAGVESVLGGIASQAQMEAGSSNIKTVSPGRQHYHPAHPKAWGRIAEDGTVNAGYGVTSVTKNGDGDYTVNLSITLSSANYAVVATPFKAVTADAYIPVVIAQTTTTFRLEITSEGGNPLAVDGFSFILMGDL